MAQTSGPLNGTNVDLFIDTVKVAFIREFSIDPSANMIDTSSKDSGGDSEFIGGRKTATISASAVFAFDSLNGYQELRTAFENRTKVAYILSNENVGDFEWGGNAYVSGLPVTFPDDDVVTFDIEFQVTGARTYTEITA